MLVQSEVARYLLLKGLITAESIVDGNLQVVESSRRNQNWKVINPGGTSYFLKQGIGSNKAETVTHESTVYQLFSADPGKGCPGRHLPRFVSFDNDHRVLILELLTEAKDFREYHTSGRFSTVFASELGRVLSEVHGAGEPRRDIPTESNFSARLPWVLGLHRPNLSLFRDASNANLQLIRILQNVEGFAQTLDRLRQQWKVDGLIHNDIKWDNCLAVREPRSARKPEIKIVDWEFAGLGDRCWDVGAVLSNYLSFWLLSIPITGAEPPDRFVDLARYPLESMQPALRAYWAAYVKGMELGDREAGEWLLRSVSYAGARLVQTGFEQMQFSTRLTGNLVCLLQLSLNIMQRPYEAAIQLLGIPGAAS
ncbi:MAG: aminoglycoside phosphotransferase family protein [Acidobacteriota bacterium]|nr:aminoglycoside phosphotransferase family protein [Acidobacteriota bacterium]